jgi:hypothetical protein
MRKDRIIGALALTGAMAGGAVAGALLGIPGISGAQTTTSEATTTTTEAPATTTEAPTTTTEAPTTTTEGTAPAAPDETDPNERRRFGGCHFGPFGGSGFSLEAAAGALGMSESDLAAQLRDGKTLAEVAADEGVDVQKVIDALVADANERIDQAVSDGKLTAERAAAIKEGLEDRITRLVNEGPPFKFGHRGPRFPGFSLEAAAGALGMSESDLAAQLRDGKTLAEVAADKGVDAQKVIDALVAGANERIDQAVSDGKLSAERAAELKDGLKDRITRLVNEGFPPKHDFPRSGGPGRGFFPGGSGFFGPAPGSGAFN